MEEDLKDDLIKYRNAFSKIIRIVNNRLDEDENKASDDETRLTPLALLQFTNILKNSKEALYGRVIPSKPDTKPVQLEFIVREVEP